MAIHNTIVLKLSKRGKNGNEKNRYLVLILTFILIVSSVGGAFAANMGKAVFDDIEEHWGGKMIESLISYGVINDSLKGAASFQPDEKITRAEAVELALKANLPEDLLMAELRNMEDTNSFIDTTGHKLKNYIELSRKFEIVVGYGDGTFKPNGPITREELATVLVRSQDVIDKIAEGGTSNYLFSDVDEARWSYNYITTAARSGMVFGYPDGTYRPQSDISRAEAYTMVDNYYNICFIRFKGVVGFAAVDGMPADGIEVGLINNKDAIVQSVKTNKYGQFRFRVNEIGEYRIEATDTDLFGVIPKVKVPQSTSLLGSRLQLEGTVQVTGTAYNTSRTVLNKGDLSFESDDFTFETTTDKEGKFEFKLPPNRSYRVYRILDGTRKFIAEFKVGTIPIKNLIPKPLDLDSGNDSGDNGGDNMGRTGSNPSIIVLTEFPAGTVTNNIIDIKYTATASRNASITEVSYSINDGAMEYLYLSGSDSTTAKGSIGTGRVFLIPGENNIVFYAKDSSGKTATFSVRNKPYYDFGSTPEYDVDYLEDLSGDSGSLFVTNRIVAYAKSGVTTSQIEAAISSINGAIISQINVLDMYTIQVPVNTEMGLLNICSNLMEGYPHLFDDVFLDIVDEMDVEAVSHTKDPWWNDWTLLRWYNNQWGLTAINVPDVWDNYSGHLRNVKVGVVDNGFRYTHEDLRIPASNIHNRNLADKNHGTHVIGTIGAIHNNNKGLAGVVNIKRNSLYGYDSFNILGELGEKYASRNSIITGLSWNVAHGAKIINFSLGSGKNTDGGRDISYSIAMEKLIGYGYDFVVIHSAGNSTGDASRNGVFAYVTEENLRERIITVGATDKHGKLASFTNYGEIVDVVAPGVKIYSSWAKNDSAYKRTDGTSMAAPHVTGVAALVWAANPGLSGRQVKQIIVDSAKNFGLKIADTRKKVPKSERLTYCQVNANAAVEMAIGKTPALTKGRLTGQVIAAMPDGSDGDVINGAHISLHSGINDEAITETTTEEDGQYTINGITTGRYYLQIAAEGYITEKFFIQIEAGVTTHIHRLRTVPSSDQEGKISGAIINAFTGSRVQSEITLEFRRGIDFDTEDTDNIEKSITTSSGSYSVDLPAGNYTVTAKGSGYIATNSYVYSYGGSNIGNQDIVISPEFVAGGSGLRIVLTWGELPKDLDSHLAGPTPEGERFHIYFANKEYHYASPGEESGLYANLDVDDVTSYGPETVTVYTFADGSYDYYVHDYTNRNSTTSDYLRNSQAVVRIYSSSNQLLRTFNVPTGGGASSLWHVFTVNVQNGDYSIVPVNRMINEPTSPGDIGMGTSNSRSRSITENLVYLSEDEIEAKTAAEIEAGIFEELNNEAINESTELEEEIETDDWMDQEDLEEDPGEDFEEDPEEDLEEDPEDKTGLDQPVPETEPNPDSEINNAA